MKINKNEQDFVLKYFQVTTQHPCRKLLVNKA